MALARGFFNYMALKMILIIVLLIRAPEVMVIEITLDSGLAICLRKLLGLQVLNLN